MTGWSGYMRQNRQLIAAWALVLGLATMGQENHARAAEASPILVTPGAVGSGLYQESPLSFEPIALHFRDPTIERVGHLTYLGGLQVRSEDKRFGGLSGLQISSDGQTMLAISDRGYWVGATLDYDGDRLVGMRNVIVSPLLDRNGRPLNDKDKKEADAEAIAELPGSGIVVSFEGNNRLWHYGATLSDAIFGKRPHPLPLPVDIAKAIKKLPENGAIEAIATMADGTLLAIAEDGEEDDGNHLAWLIGATTIAQFTYRTDEDFSPTDASFLPNGDLVVLERRFTLLHGLATRLKLVKKRDIKPDKVVAGAEVASLAFPFNIDNMEGITARQGAAGETLLYLVSDDNYNPLQRTMVMVFRLEE